MLESTNQEIKELDFLRTFEKLDVVIAKAQLIRKIEDKSAESESATSEQLDQIKQELKHYRDQIRALDQHA